MNFKKLLIRYDWEVLKCLGKKVPRVVYSLEDLGSLSLNLIYIVEEPFKKEERGDAFL